jgi:hypothetical protein
MKAVVSVVAVVLFIGLIFGGWWIKRKVNYDLIYKGLVQETIREMVKPESLK